MDLERRLDRLESRTAILDLAARYCHGADDREAETFESVWHADAVWDVTAHQFEGREAILEAVARQWSMFASMQHSTSNSVVEFESDDEATGRHDVLTITELDDGRVLLSTGRYWDTYTRVGGRWGIALRRAAVVTTTELSRSAGDDLKVLGG